MTLFSPLNLFLSLEMHHFLISCIYVLKGRTKARLQSVGSGHLRLSENIPADVITGGVGFEIAQKADLCLQSLALAPRQCMLASRIK